MPDETALVKVPQSVVTVCDKDGNEKLITIEHMRRQEEFQHLLGLGKAFFDSGVYGLKSPAEGFAKLHFAVEHDIPLTTALAQVHIVQGKPVVAADLMVAMVMRSGKGTIEREETDDYCITRGTRTDNKMTYEAKWDRQRIELAGLTNKDNHKKHPKEMRRHRADTECVRALWPEVVGGMYSPDEADEIIDVQVVSPTSVTEAVKTALGVPRAPVPDTLGVPNASVDPQPDDLPDATVPLSGKDLRRECHRLSLPKSVIAAVGILFRAGALEKATVTAAQAYLKTTVKEQVIDGMKGIGETSYTAMIAALGVDPPEVTSHQPSQPPTAPEAASASEPTDDSFTIRLTPEAERNVISDRPNMIDVAWIIKDGATKIMWRSSDTGTLWCSFCGQENQVTCPHKQKLLELLQKEADDDGAEAAPST